MEGHGLHSGNLVKLRVHPASADYGVWFRRTDVQELDQLVPALYDMVTDTKLCTRISNSDGVSVQTIEHLMAALAGTGIHNALIEVDGPELPILDGSARLFVQEILAAGLVGLDANVRGFRVEKEVLVRDGRAWAKLEPSDVLSINFEIDYSDTVIGWQALSLTMKNGSFVRELCDSRTFCRSKDIVDMRSQGLALGGSHENAIVLESDRIQNLGGLRSFDECVRHKMLDAMGDLSLVGGPMIGAYSASCGGHSLTNKLLHKAFSEFDAIKPQLVQECDAMDLPGFGICESDLNRLI
jgi:UDP-3-O-[3-hydroxymyristoyl] N-acetylglucosamine deacetylase